MSVEGFVTFAAQADPPFFVCLPIEWRKVMKRLLPVRLSVRGGTPRETPKASSLVAAMSLEELRSFSQIPTIIRLEVLDSYHHQCSPFLHGWMLLLTPEANEI